MSQHRVAIVWLRRALRLADNPALAHALEAADAVVVAAPARESRGGAASRAWRARSLAALDASLREYGTRLVVVADDSAATLAALVAECGAALVCFDRAYEPGTAAADARTWLELGAGGIEARGFDCTLLNEPAGPLASGGGPFKVFTPYYNACLRLGAPDAPLPAPQRIPAPDVTPPGEPLPEGTQHPIGGWWTPGEAGALAAARHFAAGALADYPVDRDRPDLIGTSRLSPHLAFGEISPRQVVALLADAADAAGAGDSAAEPATDTAAGAAAGAADSDDGTRPDAASAFIRQLYWREFAYHTLHHFPETPERPLRTAFERMGWAEDPAGFAAWCEGRTGYPIVDAGMRELAATGWMHNRVRMIVASFLTKDLLLPWQDGARHFREHLADADLANNTFGWQWVAGSGADAAPYFRVFNPTLQGQKHDPRGAYVRAWVPELAGLPDAWIHRPWEASAGVLAQAGVTLGETYPAPIVDHPWARQRALAAYGAIRGGRG